ncbi:MAG TPA: polysaccharide deacetylase family protein [Firmicutes bacterium]|nr:polysaccharide deacetylase family protein [Bacillota bacterium]
MKVSFGLHRLAKPRRFLLPLLVIIAVAGGLYAWRSPRIERPVVEAMVVSPPSSEMPVFYIKTRDKKVALTFDISWGTKTLPLVLQVLRNANQRATFFVSSPWVEMHPELAREIVAAGHEIASHGEKHVNLSTLGKAQVIENIATAGKVIEEKLGVKTKYLRPPNGDYDDVVISAAKELGYETVIWAVDSLDWKNPGVQFMVDRVKKLVFPGAILLFHASDSAKQTHLALPLVLEQLRKDGYQLLTLGELWTAGQPGRDDPRGKPRMPQ